MAKRKKTSLTQDIIQPDIEVKVEKDPLAEQIKSFKDKGWDNNRIAARLMISKAIVEKY